MVSPERLRVRAVLSSVVDGLALGGVIAAREFPARSARRLGIYVALTAVTAADAVTLEPPAPPRAAKGEPPLPLADADLRSFARYVVVQLAWSAALTLGEKRVVAALRRRGSARPRRVLGAGVGLAVAASTLPIWWQRAVDWAADDAAAPEAGGPGPDPGSAT